VIESEAPTAAPVAANGGTELDVPDVPGGPDTASEIESGTEGDGSTDAETE
jgi:hypothetical protein